MKHSGVFDPTRHDVGNELWLVHGTRTTDPEAIWSDDFGFDFRHSKAGMYGRASYFAEQASYSDAKYAYRPPDRRGVAQLFLARVAAGNIQEVCAPKKTIIRPAQGYHSIRGEVSAGTSMHI